MMNLAKLLYTKRQRLRLTQRTVAEACGVSHQAYSAWEAGGIPSLKYAVRLSRVLNIQLKRLADAAERSAGEEVRR